MSNRFERPKRFDPDGIDWDSCDLFDAPGAPISPDVIDFMKRPSPLENLVARGIVRAVRIPEGQSRFQPELRDRTRKDTHDDLV